MPTTSARPPTSVSAANGSHAANPAEDASILSPSDTFIHRHVGPDEHEQKEMLGTLGYASLDALADAAVPPAIRLRRALQLEGVAGGTRAKGEFEVLTHLKLLASQNKVYRSFIGQGYSDTITPPVILRNILENPGWYTQYTPYQAEISQGRLEALLNFQTMVSDLTGLPLAGASLLDEGTAAAEAMAMCFAIAGGHEGTKKRFFVDVGCHPQTIAVVQTRATSLGITITVGDHREKPDGAGDLCGILVQYPTTDGRIDDYSEMCERAHAAGITVVAAADLLALTLIKPPGEWGADICVGSAQRFGVPMGAGGPHAAFIATKTEHARKMPGRIIGVSKDAQGDMALRMAIQTREQHIKRERATSNICTAQALLAIIAGMYAVYHGPEGLKAIATRVRTLAILLADGLGRMGLESFDNLFDTVTVGDIVPEIADRIMARAASRGINLRRFSPESISISVDETTTTADVDELFWVFGLDEQHISTVAKSLGHLGREGGLPLPTALARTTPFLTHPVFNTHHSETEMLRYIFQLQGRDLSLAHSMIPLGSCTMKLNATSEMIPVTWFKSAWQRYVGAVVIVLIGIGLKIALFPLFGRGLGFLTLYPAVMLAAVLGGFGPGFLAAILSAMASAFLWTTSGDVFWTSPLEWLRTAIFLGSSGLISFVAGAGGRARIRLEERTADLVRSNAMLQREADRREGAEARLRESEDRFRLATASDGIRLFEQDSELRYTWLYPPKPENQAALGRTDGDLLPGPEGEALMTSKAQVLATGDDLRMEVKATLPGGIRYFDTFISAKRTSSGAIVGVAGAGLDITERKRAEENRQRLAAAVEFSDDAVIGNNLEGLITSWNGGAVRTFGFAADEIIGRSIKVLVPANRAHEEPQLLRRVFGGERIEHFETRRQRKDGREIDVSLTISPIRNERGEIIGAAKIAREITQRVRREQTARLLSTLNSRIVALDDAEEIVRVASEITGRHLGAQRCYFGEWDEDTGRVSVTHDWASDQRASVAGRHELGDFVPSASWRRLAAGMSVTDVEADPSIAGLVEHYRSLGIRSYVASGFERKKPRVVSLVATAERPRIWTRHELQLLKAVVQRVWPLVERARSEAALRISERQLRLVTDSAPVFLAHLDRERRFKFVNETFARRHGRPAAEMVGMHVRDVVDSEVGRLFSERLDEAFMGRRVEFEMELLGREAAWHWVHVTYTPEPTKEGRAGVLALITDITARKEAERAVEHARDRALAASRAKDDFIAALSHELRTPLNPVLLIASEAAENMALAPDVRRDFVTIRKGVELEARLIDDLLDLTRITNGKLPLERRAVAVETVLHDALSVIRPEVERKRIALSVDLCTPEVVVDADPVRLQQVFWNVLKNAVKFTPPGGRVNVCTAQPGDISTWRVTVEDTGIGMTDAEVQRVFDAFAQGDHAMTEGSQHRFGGVGLGLTISRMLVEMQGGTIRGMSAGRGQGSTFTIELPVVSAAALSAATTESVDLPLMNRAKVLPTSRRVLLVEDHGPTREALASLLRRRDMEVLTAGSVGEARERMTAGKFSLVVSDIGLPDGDGCDLMAELREDYGLRGIALTGYGREADIARSARAGFLAHLTKPIRVQALDAALASAWASDDAA